MALRYTRTLEEFARGVAGLTLERLADLRLSLPVRI